MLSTNNHQAKVKCLKKSFLNETKKVRETHIHIQQFKTKNLS